MSSILFWPEAVASLAFAALCWVGVVLHRTGLRWQMPLLSCAVSISVCVGCLLVFGGHPDSRTTVRGHAMFYPGQPGTPQAVPLRSTPGRRSNTRTAEESI